MNGVYLLLGSNMGNRMEYLRLATMHLAREQIQILEESSIYETAPWGSQEQGWFLNVVLEIVTQKSPDELLKTLLSIEESIGRVRKEKWGERIIDIDVLYFDDVVLSTQYLTIPHPEIQKRRFTLVPMAEIAPMMTHPTLGKNQLQLLAECTDPLDCRLTDYKL